MRLSKNHQTAAIQDPSIPKTAYFHSNPSPLSLSGSAQVSRSRHPFPHPSHIHASHSTSNFSRALGR